MGVVYRARDTRLDRSVAIKVIADAASHDAGRRARIEQEARAIAALNHTHICTLYDVGSHDGSTYLVMEYLEGETLANQLHRGPLPVNTALAIAADIADALTAAHRIGIVHRDLKPGNVMLTKSGVKLLDFGLAKLTAGPDGAGAVTVARPTTLTSEGTILGTLPYMSPEQVEGRQVDARSDLWALGAIVYEMVSGARAFEGATPTSLAAAILERQPVPLADRQRLTPPALDRLVRLCLAKSPEDRWDTAHDVSAELRWIRESEQGPAPVAGRGSGYWRRLALPSAAAIVGALVTWLVTSHAGGNTVPPGQVIRASLSVQPAEALAIDPKDMGSWTRGGPRTAFAWTPDAKTLVYAGWRQKDSQLYARSVDKDDARPLVGTEGAWSPSISPDGRWVAFLASDEIRKVPLAGGPIERVTTVTSASPTRLSWTEDGDLVYDASDGIHRITPRGERVLTHTAPGTQHLLASMLPGDRVLVYTDRRRTWTWGDEEIVALELSTGTTRVLLRDAEDARYLASGYLLFLRRGELFAVPFDPGKAEVRGSPTAILDGVSQALTGANSGAVSGAGQFDVSPAGALAWVPAAPVRYPETSLVAVTRSGVVTKVPVPAHSYGPVVRVSPDGNLFAMSIRSLAAIALCVFDRRRGTLTTLRNSGEVDWPTWSPDGGRILFQVHALGKPTLEAMGPYSSDASRTIAEGDFIPSSWSHSGRELAVFDNGGRVRILTMAERGTNLQQEPPATPPSANSVEFSPDGHWLAYAADNSGRSEVFVQPYPGPGPRLQVSTREGFNPSWNPRGGELFFLEPGDASGPPKIVVVTLARTPVFTASAPRPVFPAKPDNSLGGCGPTRCYDVSPDGQTFYEVRYPATVAAPPVTHINLVLNWLEEMREKVPASPQ